MSLSSRVYAEDGADVTNQISRIDVYQKFLPHGAKAKHGIDKKKKHEIEARILQNAKCENSNEARYEKD